MSPLRAMNYLTNIFVTDAKTTRKVSHCVLACGVFFSDFQNKRFCANRVGIVAADLSGLPAFIYAVLLVFLPCASKQVKRVDAARIIAVVTAIKGWINATVRNNIRKPMSLYMEAINSHRAVFASPISGTLPIPTFTRLAFYEFAIKSFRYCSPLNECGPFAPLRRSALGGTSASHAALTSHYRCRLADFIHGVIVGNRLGMSII